jgi:hypothetical protein
MERLMGRYSRNEIVFIAPFIAKNETISCKIVIVKNEAVFIHNERLLQKLRNFAMTATQKTSR